MRRKSLIEFVSFLDAFPSSIASAMENGWTAADVRQMSEEIKKLASIPTTPQERAYGALKPD